MVLLVSVVGGSSESSSMLSSKLETHYVCWDEVAWDDRAIVDGLFNFLEGIKLQ